VPKALLLVAALSGCVPAHRVAHPTARTPEWALVGDFSLLCVAGAASVATYNAGRPAVFVPVFSAYLALIALDTWAAR
jgi:hypothetical protein